jgi:hypothetical protein
MTYSIDNFNIRETTIPRRTFWGYISCSMQITQVFEQGGLTRVIKKIKRLAFGIVCLFMTFSYPGDDPVAFIERNKQNSTFMEHNDEGITCVTVCDICHKQT